MLKYLISFIVILSTPLLNAINIGVVPLYKPVEFDYFYENNSNSSITIHSIEADCDVTLSNETPLLVEPNSNVTLKFTLHPKNFGIQNYNIKIIQDIGSSTFPLSFVGSTNKLIGPLSDNLTIEDDGILNVVSMKEIDFNINESKLFNASILETKEYGDYFLTSIKIESNKEEYGIKEEPLYLTLDNSEIALPLILKINLSDVEVKPSFLSFGSLKQGSTKSLLVYINKDNLKFNTPDSITIKPFNDKGVYLVTLNSSSIENGLYLSLITVSKDNDVIANINFMSSIVN